MKLLSSLLFLFTISFSSASAQTPIPDRYKKIIEEYNTERDIIYKTVGDDVLDMILFLPKQEQASPMPVMLYTHGGGWGKGDKFKIFNPASRQTLQLLLENGIACASIEYRLTRNGISNAIDCVEDCKDAAKYLVKHAKKYNLDPDRMGVFGGSAGGHLSLMTGLADDKLFESDPELKDFTPNIRCIASYYPATTFQKPELMKGSNFERPQRMIPMIGGLAEEFPDRVALLSPTEHITKDSPSVLLIHGDKDKVLPIGLSKYFISVAGQKQANARLITVTGGYHGFRGDNIEPGIEEINKQVADFLIGHLKGE